MDKLLTKKHKFAEQNIQSLPFLLKGTCKRKDFAYE